MKEKNIEQKRRDGNTYQGLNPIELIYASYHRCTSLRTGELSSFNRAVHRVGADKYICYRQKASASEKRKIVESIVGDTDRGEDTDWKSGIRIVYFRDITKNNEHMLIRALEEEPLAKYSMWERWCIVDNQIVLNPEQSEKLIAKMLVQRYKSLREEDQYLESLLLTVS